MVPVVLLVIAVFLYSPYISAAPLQASGPYFENLRHNTTLQRFQNTLLNETFLPFLKTCYDPKCCTKGEQLICPIYFELLLNVNNTNISDDVIKSQADSLRQAKKDDEKTLKEFCSTFSTQVSASNLNWTTPVVRTFLGGTGCNATCSELTYEGDEKKMSVSIKPVCKFVVWMFNVTTKAMPTEAKIVVNSSQDIQLNPVVTKESSKVAAPEKTDLTGESMPKIAITKPTPAIAKLSPENIPQQELQDGSIAQPIAKKPPTPTSVATKESVFAEESDINSKTKGAIPATPDIAVQKAAANNDNASELPSDFKSKPDDSNRRLNSEEASKPIDMDVNPGLDETADNTSQEDSMQKDDLDDGFNDIPPQAETSQPARNPMFEDPLKPRLSMITKDSSDAYIHDPFHQEEGSNFFTYFLIGMFACIILYVLYHNKTKILALLLEGRRSQKGRGSRRKHTAQYRKLDTNLEEAITSTPSGRSTQIIY